MTFIEEEKKIHTQQSSLSQTDLPGLFYSLQHGIGVQLLENCRIWNAENVIDDVHETVGRCNVILDNCCVHAAPFDGNRAVVVAIENVEVEEFLLNICGYLQNL